MKLSNATPTAARLDISEVQHEPQRLGLLTVKATFRFDASGQVELDSEQPFPLFPSDLPTALGLLPAELEPRTDPLLEVILLGHAHAPHGTPVSAVTVALSVGDVRREIRVSGDRVWQGTAASAQVSLAEPFVKMPLTYARAFGGSATVLLDAKSPFGLRDSFNPHGKGFDPLPQLASFDQLKPPPGYPKLVDWSRTLPNLEHPRQLIQRWEDAPEPCCWAAQPHDVLVAMSREVQKAMSRAEGGTAQKPELEYPSEAPSFRAIKYRAHPDWVIPVPASAPLVRLENLMAGVPALQFALLDMCFVADYALADRSGSRKLTPHTLLLLPDDRKFYILYRLPFTFPFAPGEERALRLRIAPGWSAGESD